MSNQVYSNDDSQYSVETEFVGAKVIQGAYINGQTGTFNSMVINDLQQDNSLDKVVVWDFDTSELKYSTAIGATGLQGPTGAMGPQGPNGATGSQGPTGATGISVKTSGYLELPLGITVTLTNPMPNFINITAGGAGFNINLPQMDLPDSLQSSPIGTFYIYKNHAGSQITIVNDFAGSPIVTLYPGKIYIFEVASNATPQGSFVFKELTDVVSATSPLSLNATTGELSINLSNYVDLSSSQNLLNKTLTTPIMATVFNANNVNSDVSLSAASGGDEFMTTLAPQDALEKHFNAEFGNGSYFYSNTGTNRKLKFNITSATNNTATTLRAVQTSDINVTLPSSTGQIALVSQIPTNTSYVDLTTNQTVAGVKTFSASPVFNGPTNQTFPTYIPVGIHNINKDLQAITNMASIDTSQTLLNKTISTLTAIGTTQNLLSGKQVTSYFTATTTTNTPTTIFTQPMSANESLTLEIDCTAFCTLGADLDKIRGFSSVYLIKRTSLGVMQSYTISSNVAGDGGYAPVLSILPGPGNFSLQVTGVTGNTINWGGNYCINNR